MELSLEGIIEQLLVGALASLLVLSFIFFAFGHIWNVPMMRRFFDTLFGERSTGAEGEEPSPGTPATTVDERDEGSRPTVARIRRPKKEAGEDQSHISFALILLLAILYGLGLIWEAGSHWKLHPDNVESKRQAFYEVASGKLKSGTASPRLARFVSDYTACRNVKGLPKNLPWEMKKDDPTSLCHQIDERVTQFFYNAKNVVFQHREYYEELSVLETRINFMLSFRTLSLLFVWELGVVFVFAFIAEVGRRNRPGLWTGWMNRLFAETKEPVGDGHEGKRRTLKAAWRKGTIELGDHWVGIAAFHILLLVGASAGLWMLTKNGCDYSENQFAKRVYGYYLALVSEHEGVKENGEGKHVAGPVDLTPESPYHMFSLSLQGDEAQPGETAHHHDHARAGEEEARPADVEDAHPMYGPISAADAAELEKVGPGGLAHEGHGAHAQRRLEPAAVQILGNTSQVLVASDQGGDEPFWLFTLNEDATEMQRPRPLHVVHPGDRAKLRAAGTIESLAAFEAGQKDIPFPESKACLPDGEHKIFRVFAGPHNFGQRPAHLLSFCLKIDPSPREQAETQIGEIESQDLPSPCMKVLGTETCDVEGIAFRTGARGQTELLLGVQQAGKSATVVIVRMTWDKGAWIKPEQIFPARDNKCSVDSNIDAMMKVGGGISDLAAAPSGRIYVTTSFQRDDAPAGGGGKSGPASGSQVGGALWLLDLGCKVDQDGDPCHCADQKATLLETFIHKPDGVSHDNGSVLVVFDDEARRKSRQWAPKTFPLAQDEAVFAIVPSPEFR